MFAIITTEVQKFSDKKVTWEKRKKEELTKLRKFLLQFKTSKNLLEVAPEIEPYIKDYLSVKYTNNI